MTREWMVFLVAYITGCVILLCVAALTARAVTLVEPTQKADGSLLTGLDSCTAFWAAPDGTATGSQQFTASSESGGGSHLVTLTGAGEGTTREVYGTCLRVVNGTGAVSARSNTLTETFPTIAPAAPVVLP